MAPGGGGGAPGTGGAPGIGGGEENPGGTGGGPEGGPGIGGGATLGAPTMAMPEVTTAGPWLMTC